MKPWNEKKTDKTLLIPSIHLLNPRRSRNCDEQRQVSWLALDLTLVLPVQKHSGMSISRVSTVAGAAPDFNRIPY
jgi:hypothetical protein